jgi:DNA-binding NarL/FixJ family response regulator
MSGAVAAERIARDCPDVRVLALTMHEDRGYVSRMLGAGVTGYVLKRSASTELIKAIRAVATGERYIDPALSSAAMDAMGANGRTDKPPRVARLTGRENEVLRLLAFGHSNKEIATALAISVKTVETHRATGMARLGITSRAALVRFALDEGWLHDNPS